MHKCFLTCFCSLILANFGWSLWLVNLLLIFVSFGRFQENFLFFMINGARCRFQENFLFFMINGARCRFLENFLFFMINGAKCR
ncbi:uncharacterized protein LOC122723950 isoform X3 [Manihot esculenta]|uniref:uncharacterized protein LOC122723950 isoform X3 n=1 Tax=Manihot esculenta TaxID=3983 RepID=UPI001CC4B111|nr:uncharacterized protein LOC122723950 isoform X3 [Manihot esculenta]